MSGAQISGGMPWVRVWGLEEGGGEGEGDGVLGERERGSEVEASAGEVVGAIVGWCWSCRCWMRLAVEMVGQELAGVDGMDGGKRKCLG